jgi:phosphate acetyltransferase/phosphate butyryltransferase
MNDDAQATPRMIRNRVFDDIAIGDSASIERTLTAADLHGFTAWSGEADAVDAGSGHDLIAPGLWAASLIAALLATRLPGPGTAYFGQTLHFRAPVRIGDSLHARVEVIARDSAERRVTLACACINQDGTIVIDGEAQVIAPAARIERPSIALPPQGLTDGIGKPLLERARPLGPVRVAVVHPCDESSLSAVFEAMRAGLIEPLLVAPRARLEAVARAAGLDLSGLPIEDVPHSHAAAARAVALAGACKVEALMKGCLHTDELMSAVLAHGSPLRTERRASHCYLMQTPAYPRPFIITDAAINIAPDLGAKADIVRNAIELARIIGVDHPRVAILAAVETINARMPATLDAAALCKMADRGQIAGATLDGPLAFDNAISAAAARIKGIASPVAGMADVLVVPDLESGNMLAKQLEYLGGASSAGLVMGARVPIVLTSRADTSQTRTASCALAALVAHRYREVRP